MARRCRSLLLQAAAAVLVLWFGWEIVSNMAANLAERNIASGFGFLEQPAGFGIIQTLVPYDETSSYGRAFVVGLLNTLLVAVIGIVLATALGVMLGVARLSRNWLIAKLAAAYLEIVRNVPLLLQLFFWYFAVLRQLPPARQSLELGAGIFLNSRGLYLPWVEPQAQAWWLLAALLAGALAVWGIHRAADGWRGRLAVASLGGVAVFLALGQLITLLAGPVVEIDMPQLRGLNFAGGIKIIPELVALVLALSLYTAAFIGEIVRAGIQSVPRGQIEAAKALGLRPAAALRLVVLPQALRLVIPPLTSQYLNLTKNSSLAVAIAYPDLVSVFAGTVLNQTGQAVEVLAITMAVYLTLSLLTAAAMNWYNAWLTVRGARA